MEVSNYRPISHLYKIDKNFTQKTSQQTMSILTLLERIQKAVDNGQYACRIFIDLKNFT